MKKIEIEINDAGVLLFYMVVYSVAWYLLAGKYPKLNNEIPQLLMAGPFMWLMMLLIVEGGKWEESQKNS